MAEFPTYFEPLLNFPRRLTVDDFLENICEFRKKKKINRNAVPPFFGGATVGDHRCTRDAYLAELARAAGKK